MKGFSRRAGGLFRTACESVAMAAAQFRKDRFRTVLSLAGIAIGIFSTVAALTVVDSLQRAMNEGLSDFGKDVVLVEQIPLEPDLDEEGGFRWWNYISRPPVTREEYRFLAEYGETIHKLCYTCYFNNNVIIGVTGDWGLAIRNPIREGRAFSAAEITGGAAVAVVGADYAKDHPGEKSLSLEGHRFEIIGVFGRSGVASVSLADIDAAVVIPEAAARRLPSSSDARCVIAARPKAGIPEAAFDAELRRLLRQARHLDPQAEDNFALNRFSFIEKEMTELFSLIDTIGWIIGLFSLLVGGFGIANILFVAVRERTRQIGIQKALGASRGVISLQFLSEAAVLSAAGGAAGLGGVALVTLLLRRSPVPILLTGEHIAAGMTAALIIGIAAGMAPAISAAKMHPAVALNSPEGDF